MRINAELAADRAALRHTSTEQLAGALVKVMRAMAPVAPHATVAALSTVRRSEVRRSPGTGVRG
jgi:hypothetical protein